MIDGLACLSVSLNIFTATIALLGLWRHLATIPYVPSPMVPKFS